MCQIKQCLRQNLRNHLYDILLLLVGYFYNFMSTQAKDVIEKGVEGVDDALIDSLIDAAHFDDLVLEKDVFDHAKMITVHALLLQMYFTLTANRQPIMDVLFFSMKGTRNRGNRSNYRKLLSEETLLDETSLQNAMLDRENKNGFKLVYIFVISGMRLQSIK